jgi:hypothetical protein
MKCMCRPMLMVSVIKRRYYTTSAVGRTVTRIWIMQCNAYGCCFHRLPFSVACSRSNKLAARICSLGFSSAKNCLTELLLNVTIAASSPLNASLKSSIAHLYLSSCASTFNWSIARWLNNNREERRVCVDRSIPLNPPVI